MHTEAINHDPAITFFQTRQPAAGPAQHRRVGQLRTRQREPEPARLRRPDLAAAAPSMTDQPLFSRLWGSGFLPSSYQGVKFRSGRRPGAVPLRPAGIDDATRAARCSTASGKLNQHQAREAYGDPEIDTRIAQYEMAFRMQSSVPELIDLSKEPESTSSICTAPKCASRARYAANCLLARRLAERGVRFIQLYHRGWDQHNDLPRRPRAAMPRHRPAHRRPDQRPEAARPARRHARRLGRRIRPHRLLPGQADRSQLRPRSPPALLHIWLAGGGIKPGFTFGETDDFSYNITEDPVHVHDLQATILQCLGIDHKRLTLQVPGPPLPPDRRPRRDRETHSWLTPSRSASSAPQSFPVRDNSVPATCRIAKATSCLTVFQTARCSANLWFGDEFRVLNGRSKVQNKLFSHRSKVIGDHRIDQNS